MNIYILMDWNRYIHVCVMNTTYHNLACSKIRKLELRYHHLSFMFRSNEYGPLTLAAATGDLARQRRGLWQLEPIATTGRPSS